MDIDRIYASLDRVNDALVEQGRQLAVISQGQNDTRERLFGANGQPGALHFMQGEIAETNKVVAKHTGQLTFYRGAIAVLVFVWSAAVGIAVAIINHHK